MSAIVLERTIAPAPERVFTALTQQDEIVRWWSNEASVKPEVGSLRTPSLNRHTRIGTTSWIA